MSGGGRAATRSFRVRPKICSSDRYTTFTHFFARADNEPVSRKRREGLVALRLQSSRRILPCGSALTVLLIAPHRSRPHLRRHGS